MKIREKIKIGVGVPLIIFLTFAVISYVQIKLIGKNFEQITEVDVPRNEAMSRMEVGLIGIGFELMGYIQDHNPERLESIRNYEKNLRRHQNAYCRLAETKEAELLAVMVDRNYAALSKIVEELINLKDHQAKRLVVLHNNFRQMGKVLGEGFMADIKAGDQNAYEKLKAVVQMRDGIDEIKCDLNNYLVGNQQNCEENIYKHQQDAERFISTYKGLGSASKQTQWLEQLGDIHAESMKLIKDAIALNKRQKDSLEEYIKARESLRLVLGRNIENTNASLQKATEFSRKAISIYVAAIPVIVFVSLIIVLISQTYVTYLITLPIAELRDTAVKLSQWKNNTKIYVESDDELGQLADSICKIAENLKDSRMLLDEHNAETPRPEKIGTAVQS